MKMGLAGESVLREQTARIRKCDKNQDPCEEIESDRNNPRHKSKTVEQ
jgi:hypothetical protein